MCWIFSGFGIFHGGLCRMWAILRMEQALVILQVLALWELLVELQVWATDLWRFSEADLLDPSSAILASSLCWLGVFCKDNTVTVTLKSHLSNSHKIIAWKATTLHPEPWSIRADTLKIKTAEHISISTLFITNGEKKLHKPLVKVVTIIATNFDCLYML